MRLTFTIVGTEGSNLKVGNVQYVQRDSSSPKLPTRKWASAWRQRRASNPRQVLPLLAKTNDDAGQRKDESLSQ